jgi:hypothetical protein
MFTAKFIYQEGAKKPKQYNIYRDDRQAPVLTYVDYNDVGFALAAFEAEWLRRAAVSHEKALERSRKHVAKRTPRDKAKAREYNTRYMRKRRVAAQREKLYD